MKKIDMKKYKQILADYKKLGSLRKTALANKVSKSTVANAIKFMKKGSVHLSTERPLTKADK
jgi:DNA invertase Pin-like site-specific DNA recombinase